MLSLKQSSMDEKHIFSKFKTCDPSIYKMDPPRFFVSNQKEESIMEERVNDQADEILILMAYAQIPLINAHTDQ